MANGKNNKTSLGESGNECVECETGTLVVTGRDRTYDSDNDQSRAKCRGTVKLFSDEKPRKKDVGHE